MIISYFFIRLLRFQSLHRIKMLRIERTKSGIQTHGAFTDQCIQNAQIMTQATLFKGSQGAVGIAVT